MTDTSSYPVLFHPYECPCLNGQVWYECEQCSAKQIELNERSTGNCICLTSPGKCTSKDDKCPCICYFGDDYLRWCRARVGTHNCPYNTKFEMFCRKHDQFKCKDNLTVALTIEEVN